MSVVAEFAAALDAVDELLEWAAASDRRLEALHRGGVLVAEGVAVFADVGHTVGLLRVVGEGDDGDGRGGVGHASHGCGSARCRIPAGGQSFHLRERLPLPRDGVRRADREGLPEASIPVTVAAVKEHQEIHELALRHAARVAPDLFLDAYPLFEEEGTGLVHGNSSCAVYSHRRVLLSAEEILALPTTGEECECGGWRSTEFFPALLIAHRSWELNQIAERGGIADVPEALEQIERMQPWWRPDLENLGAGLAAAAALTRDNHRIELEMLGSFAARLDPLPLLRYVAAHGLRVENDVEGAREFAAWVDALNPRYARSPFPRPTVAASARGVGSRAFARRLESRERFERELDRALEGPRSVVMLERRLWSPVDGATWYTPAEVLLLSCAFGDLPHSSFAWFSAPLVVADALRLMLSAIPGAPRIGVLASPVLPPPEVRSVAEALWSENAGTWQSLDEVLAAAVVLDGGSRP